MRVRLFKPDEPWPADLLTGFEHMPRQFVDHDWIFVAEDDTCIQGMLMATPAHGLVILMRCVVRDTAPATTLVRLLGGVLRELAHRGYYLWVTVLDPTTPAEREIYRIARKWGGQQWPSPTVVMTGLTVHNRRKEAA